MKFRINCVIYSGFMHLGVFICYIGNNLSRFLKLKTSSMANGIYESEMKMPQLTMIFHTLKVIYNRQNLDTIL